MRRSSLIHLMMSASAVPGLLAATATPALAADQPAAQTPDQPDDGEIVVTAEKRSGSASRIGLSITALSGEAIQSARISDTRDIVRFVPGFTAAQSITNTPIYTLRGIGFNTPNLSSTSPVGIYVNDTAYAYPYMTQQTAYDLERVEVLKGPQGTLYGRNTTGGLVKFVTAKPGDRFEADAEIGYGSYQTVTSRGYVSGPLSDTVGARLAWTSENSSKGWQKSVTRGERLGEKDRQAARLTLVWNPDSAFRAQLVGSFWRDGSDTQAPQAILYAPETPAFALPAAAIAAFRSSPRLVCIAYLQRPWRSFGIAGRRAVGRVTTRCRDRPKRPIACPEMSSEICRGGHQVRRERHAVRALRSATGKHGIAYS